MNAIQFALIRRGGACRVSAPFLLPVLLAGVIPLHAAKTPEPAAKDRLPAGLSTSDWQSIRAAHEAWRHAIEQVKDGWQARNPAQQWTTKFDGRGFEAQPQSAEWTWGLELRSYGAGEEQREVSGTAEVKTEGNVLAYHWDETVQEWFVNGGRGLEHGFTVQERPPGPTDAPLSFVLATRGPLRAAVTGDARGVDYSDKSGATVLTYSGLRVWDADGRELDARFAPAEDGVTLQVDDKGARYPLLIDPIAQQAYVKASNPQTLDFFGDSVAVSGDTVVAGAIFEDSTTSGINTVPVDVDDFNSGAAYVFVRSGSTWTQQAYLKASNTDRLDAFGSSVAVSGDTVVVGALSEDSSATSINGNQNDNSASAAGAAYVFVRSGSTWTQQAYLKASNAAAFDAFGCSVAISGDKVVVGARGKDGNSASDIGAAYVFVRNGTDWDEQDTLSASNSGASDQFGSSVAISGDTVVVGAAGEDSSGPEGQLFDGAENAGAAYVFERRIRSWLQQAYLKASNTGAGDRFGESVAISGDTIVVGAPEEDSSANGVNGNQLDNLTVNSGAAYVFLRTGTTWSQQAYVKASNTGASDRFGDSVAISGDTLLVGAPFEDSSANGINGNQADNSVDAAGAAYVFVRNATSWSQQAYVKASKTGGYSFGLTVALSGNTAVVGARSESSSATGVNGNQNDNSAPASGAAYIFAGLGPELVITSPTTAEGQIGLPFTYQVSTSGVAPNNFVAVGLPAGLSIDTTSGLIAGTPAQEGIFPVALSATGATAADTETLTLEIAADAASLKFLPPKRAVTAGKTARLTLLVANDLTRTQNVRVVFFFVGGVSGLVEPAPINFSAPGKKKATQRPKLSRVRVEIPIPDATTAGSVGVVARVGDQTASSQLTIKARR
jgi:hypothetical protein